VHGRPASFIFSEFACPRGGIATCIFARRIWQELIAPLASEDRLPVGGPWNFCRLATPKSLALECPRGLLSQQEGRVMIQGVLVARMLALFSVGAALAYL